MNKEETRILSYLSDNLGSGGNIREMSEGISRNYGPAYYSNIYNTLTKLKKLGIIEIETEGKSKLIKLDMKNPFSRYYISEIENHKAQKISMPKEILDGILDLPEKFDIFSICALETEKYLKMGRIELLILTRDLNEFCKIIASLSEIEMHYNLKIDPIILRLGDFAQIMKADELSPLKDLILNKSILYNSGGFWGLIKEYAITAKYKKLGKFPHDLTKGELAYNYNRFGYRLNEDIGSSDKISIEMIIFSMSIRKEIRMQYGALTLLYKNIERINLGYLYYIYKRYDGLGKLKSILISLSSLGNLKANKNIGLYINLIPDKADKLYDGRMIKKYVGLYANG